MKKIFIILLTAVASFFFAPLANAQYTINDVIKDKDGSTLKFSKDNGVHVDDENKVAYSKNVSDPFSDGTYWIKLETFATGTAEKVVTSTPSDIILVLDLSSSMNSQNYTYKGTSMSRLRALRLVIEDFAKTVYDNDAKARGIDETYAGDRIAIIGYNRNASMESGGWVYINEAVQKEGDEYSGDLIDDIRGLSYNSGTRPDHGLQMAIEELLSNGQAKREEANLTVLLFTDGYPTDQAGSGLGDAGQTTQSVDHFDYPFASKALYYASRLKKEFDAKLFSVGLITSVTRPQNPNNNNQWQYRNYCRVLQMMDWISSNYPDAAFDPNSISSQGIDIEALEQNQEKVYKGKTNSTVYTGNNVARPWRNDWAYSSTGDAITLADFVPGDTETDGDKFTNDGTYCQIVDDNTDFSDIFEAISKQASGTANEALSAASSNVDIVSNSFILPDDLDATTIDDYIHVFTQALIEMDGDEYIFEKTGVSNPEILAPHNDYEYEIYNDYGTLIGTKDIDDDIRVEIVGDNGIKVTNFDYSRNFCGPIYKEDGTLDHYQGHKIIIMIPIKMNPDAVGGPNVSTNGEGSGIYTQESGDKPLVEFESPTVSLPVNVYVEKEGLTGRESAKFKIERALIPTNSDGTVKENWKISDIPESDWEYVSTIFVTNSPNAVRNEDTGNPMVRVKGMPATKQVGEDPVTHTPIQRGLVYRISEENWSWSYTPKTEPQYTVTDKIDNPFTFKNEKRTAENIDVTVRHAESKVTNIFKTGTTRQYDDSKTNVGREEDGPQGLTTTTTGGGSGEGDGD